MAFSKFNGLLITKFLKGSPPPPGIACYKDLKVKGGDLIMPARVTENPVNYKEETIAEDLKPAKVLAPTTVQVYTICPSAATIGELDKDMLQDDMRYNLACREFTLTRMMLVGFTVEQDSDMVDDSLVTLMFEEAVYITDKAIVSEQKADAPTLYKGNVTLSIV